jgi:flavin reductase (DIM6/NTAB) family NADH-FMN oxidoreductase RutF
MKDKWIPAIGCMTYGIYVLTASYEEKFNGMIASWVSQVSYEPLMIMVAVHPHRYTHRLIQKSGCFALHVLLDEQKNFLQRFKGPDPASKFQSLEWAKGHNGCPILKECSAYLECKVIHTYQPGNHTLFFGEVTDAAKVTDGESLHTGHYGGVYIGKK